MPRRTVVFLAFAVVSALVCVRLGMWQLARRDERRARNALVASRLDSAAVDAAALPRDTALVRFRAVRLAGSFDYANEHYVASRMNEGSPGVHIITPLLVPGSDTAVLVNRGWVYAPDGATVPEPERWREGDSARTVTGYAESFPAGLTGKSVISSSPRSMRWLDPRAFALRASYATAPFYVVARDAVPDARRDSVPVRLGRPSLDEGPHFSYALQWFSFALIAVVGGAVFARSALSGAFPRR